GGGLNLFNKADSSFSNFVHSPSSNSISNNNISCIFEDDEGNLWIGTDAGLNHYNYSAGTFTNYLTEDGLPNNFILGILQDDKKNLWISTKKGLSRFDPANKAFKNFGVADGLQGNEFREAYC